MITKTGETPRRREGENLSSATASPATISVASNRAECGTQEIGVTTTTRGVHANMLSARTPRLVSDVDAFGKQLDKTYSSYLCVAGELLAAPMSTTLELRIKTLCI